MSVDWKLKQAEPVFARIRNNPENRVPEQKIVICIFFVFIFLIAETLTSVIRSVIRTTFFTEDTYTDTAKLLVYTYTTVITTVFVLGCVRLLERRPFRTMGLTRHKLLRDYAAGALFGFALISAAFLLQLGCGALRNTGAAPQLPMLLMIGGWILQGFSEELVFRGWLLLSLGTRAKTWTAILISSFLFMCAHLGNSGISLIACLNLTLFGVVTALLVLRTDSLWAAAAMHSAWNWAQGNFFGCNVSGIEAGTSVLSFAHIEDAPAFLTGGAFGPEGSILTTLLLLPVIAILLMLPQRSASDADPASA